MKKILLLLLAIVFIPEAQVLGMELNNYEKFEVKLINCQSATSSWVEYEGEVTRIRLMAYDSGDTELNEEINNYACNLLKKANKIELQYDINSPTTDKYNRELVFVYVDGILLQEELIKNGYGQVNYVWGNYDYLSNLCDTQKNAIINHLGIWNYEGIEEKYCQSGIVLNNKITEEIEPPQEKKSNIPTNLKYMIFLNSGIVLLIILIIYRKRSIDD